MVRDLVDEPADGSPATAFLTDAMILTWLQRARARATRTLLRNGHYFNVFSDTLTGAGGNLPDEPTAIAKVEVIDSQGGTTYQLPRLLDTAPTPVYSDDRPRCWRFFLSETGSPTVTIYPTAGSSYTIRVWYVSNDSAITTATSVFMPEAGIEFMVAFAALRATIRANKRNPGIENLYAEALMELEGTANSFDTDGAVLRNVDHVFQPGYDQGRPIDRTNDFYDYSLYIVP